MMNFSYGAVLTGYEKGTNENKRETALKMLKDGKLSIDDISYYSGLSKEEVEKLK